MTFELYQGDAREVLRTLHDESVQCVITSPPYWGLRDYKVDGQIGLEKTPEEYVAALVAVFREVRRVLRKDGTLWLNLGDSYAGSAQGWGHGGQAVGPKQRTNAGSLNQPEAIENETGFARPPNYISSRQENGLKPKDLVGIPWRVAFALQADGWWLRSDIIWSKPNPMPESVTDRPTRAHEYVFLMAKSERYYYDAEAIKEKGSMASVQRLSQPTFEQQTGGPKDPLDGNRSCRKALKHLHDKQRGHGRRHDGFNDRWDLMTKEEQCALRVNKRSVWQIATQPYPQAHFATFPEKLVRPCILAGSKHGDVVLDPFCGAGTVGVVALQWERRFVGIELSAQYVEMARARIVGKEPLFRSSWPE